MTEKNKIILIIIIVLSSVVNTYSEYSDKKILILNSYHQGYEWTDNMVLQTHEYLKNSLNNVEIFIEYMDKKRYVNSDFSYNLAFFYKTKYKRDFFDLIICSDDDALNFILDYGEELFGNTPVVFCGVNDFNPDVILKNDNITGYIQVVDAEKIVSLALTLHSGIENIYVVSDGTVTGKAQRKTIKDIEENFSNQNFFYLNGEELTTDELIDKLNLIPANSILILSVWQRDKNGRYSDFKDLYPLISQKANCPVYGLADAWLGYGIIGGNLNSSRIQGRKAAEIGTLLLKTNLSPKKIPVRIEKPDYYLFDMRELLRWNIKPHMLPRNSEFINYEIADKEKLRKIISYSTSTVAVLLFLLFFTFFNLLQRKKALKQTIEAKEKAEIADRMKSEFLANMSHEIRTPMTSILGYTDILDNFLENSEHKKFINNIKKASNHLLYIINDLIDIARIESNEISVELKNIDLRIVFDDVETAFSKSIIKDSVVIKFDKPPKGKIIFISDFDRVKQIITNFVSNAVKFTEDGYVKIGYNIQKELVQIYVKDTGPGIDETKIDKLFERFTQGDNSYSKKYGGLGLGLTISKKIAEKIGGEIKVDSVINEGSTFSLFLPLLIEHTKNGGVPMDSKKIITEANHEKILIIDDNNDNLNLIKIMLLKKGFNPITANSGKEGLKTVEKDPSIKVILLDIQMPEMSGIEVLKAIRKLEKNRDNSAKIVAITAFAMKEDADNFFQEGFDDYLPKPFRMNELIDVIFKNL
ncbi:MAG: ATP-binding protein [Candidatus Muiribacteriota bacterium]